MGLSAVEPATATRSRRVRPPGNPSVGNGATQAPDSFIFVTSTNAKPDAASRRSIRSHVMRGKNRKRPSDKSGVQLGSWINNTDNPSWDVQSIEPIPRSMGSDLRCLPFTEELTLPMLDLVFKFFTVMKQTLYPTELCVDFEPSQWVGYLTTDTLFRYSTLYATQGLSDFLRRGNFGPDTMKYLGMSLALLRNKLATDSNIQTSNATIGAVITLALMADKFGDVESARKHVQGLHQMVHLRGGIKTFQNDPQLQVKVCRADLGFALSSGSKPLFFQEDSDLSWNPYVAAPNQPATTLMHKLHPSTPDQRLVNVWFDLQEFSRSANLAFQTGRKMRGELYQEALISAQYRLLALGTEWCHYEPPVVERIVHTGMLAFSTTSFLQIEGVPIYTEDFTTKLRQLLELVVDPDFSLTPSTPGTEQEQDGPGKGGILPETTELFLKLKLWLLFMGYISVLDQPKHYEFVSTSVRETMRALGLLTWTAVRDILMSHMWIDWTHSTKGKILVETILANQTTSGK